MAVTQVRSKQQFLVTDNVDFQAYRLVNLGAPVSDNDAVTKAYVDALKQALDVKDSVRVATVGTESFTISGGAVTHIAGTSIDGVSISIGDRILIKNAPASTGTGSSPNTTQPANGLYEVIGNTTNLTVQRSADANSNADVTTGLFVFVSEGTENGDNGYVLTTNDTIILNTTALNFTQFSGAGQITAGAGLTKTANTIDIVTASSARIVVNADSIDLATTAVSASTYGSSGYNVGQFTVDAYGRLTAASNRDLFGSSLTANTVFAAPDGSTGAPSFRVLVAADIPNLDASKITSGTLAVARGGTGLGTTPTNGQILIGNGTGYTLSTITAGTAISVTDGSGSITIANTGVTSLTGTTNRVTVSGATGSVTITAPQDIHTGATPTFASLILTAGTVTSSSPILNLTQTWNNAGVTFEGIAFDVTDTTSASNSLLMNLSVGAVDKFSVRKDGSIVTGIWAATTIAPDYGGTGLTSYAVGDLIYASGATTLAKLAGVATGNVLISGGVTTAPSWGKVGLTTHVSGTLGVGNGGTGATATPTNGQLLIGNGSTYTVASLSAGTGVTITPGSGTLQIAVTTTAILAKADYIVRETPSGTVNGSNDTFTLANTPSSGKEMVFVNGILQNEGAGNDYTISGTTITFETGAIPQTGDVIKVTYIK